MSSYARGVVYSFEVRNFRNTLTPDDTELFNECITQIYRDPSVDRVHKVVFRHQPPLIDYMYRNDHFTFIYRWEQVLGLDAGYRVTLLQAIRTHDIKENE